jgi:hypothetical protein
MSDQIERKVGWTNLLSDEDLAFLKRFILASGSLKDLAAAYGISYPTVRLRLDRLIEKIKLLDGQENISEFERVLRSEYADGKLDMETFKKLLAAHKIETLKKLLADHKQEMESQSHEKNNPAV